MAYEVKIKEASREFKGKEAIALKDTGDAIRLNQAIDNDGETIIAPVGWAILDVHNDNGEDKDYTQYLILDKSGQKYVTGSESFWTSFMDIWEEMKDEDEEYEIKAYKVKSKNRDGSFLKASIVL